MRWRPPAVRTCAVCFVHTSPFAARLDCTVIYSTSLCVQSKRGKLMRMRCGGLPGVNVHPHLGQLVAVSHDSLPPSAQRARVDPLLRHRRLVHWRPVHLDTLGTYPTAPGRYKLTPRGIKKVGALAGQADGQSMHRWQGRKARQGKASRHPHAPRYDWPPVTGQ